MGRLSLLLPFDTNKRQSACCCTAVADIAFAVVIYMSCVPQTESIFALIIPTKDFVIIYNKLNIALGAYNFHCSTYCVELILHLLEDKIFTATYSIVCLINSR
jgi:hypothetical protein